MWLELKLESTGSYRRYDVNLNSLMVCAIAIGDRCDNFGYLGDRDRHLLVDCMLIYNLNSGDR